MYSFNYRAKRKGQACWDKKYAELVEYKDQNGDCNVPTKFKERRALGRWVSTQRSNYFKRYKRKIEGRPQESLKEEELELTKRVQMLNELGFVWRMAPTSPSTSTDESEKSI